MPTRLSPPIGLLSPTQTHDPAAAAARLAARLFEGAGAAIFVVGPVREHAAGDASLADAAAALARRVVHDGAPLAEPPAGPSMHAGYPLFAADGEVIGALAVAAPKPLDDDGLEALADLARASAAELALLDATRALDDLLDHTTDMACAVDGDGRLARANRAWCVALDRGRAVRLVESPGGTGRPLADLLAPEHRAPAAALLRRLGAGGAPEDVELVLVAPDGSRVVARGRAVPRPDRGRGAGMRLALRNLTAERHAQDMRARLAATLDASSDVCFMATARGDLVYLNDAGRRIAGLSADAPLASRRLTDLWAGADARRVTREIIPAAQRDLIWQGEAELAAAEGGPVPVSAVIVAHPSAIPNEPPFFISGVLRDLRERQRAEAEMALLYRVPHLVSTADDVDSALLTALDAMCEAAAWDYGEVWLPAPSTDGAAPTMRQGPAWCNPRDAKLVAFAREGASLGVRRGEGTVGRAWATGEAEWVGQPDVEPDLARDGAARRAGLRAAAAVPVVVGDETVAVLCFVGRHPRDGESARLELLAAVGAQMGAAVLRRQAESRLTADREFLTALLQSATDGILACDADGHVTVFNRAARELFELDATLDPAAAKSAALALVSDADDRPLDPGRTPLQRARAGETLRGVELRVRPPGRAPRTLVAGGRPIRVGDDIVGAVIAFRDVTDERRAKELKDQLISTASHELRTPLAAVRGALEVLAGKVGAAGAREAELLEMARRNTG
ncbi:MAG: PAS domain-containing protein, partial [Gemmatimonadaceae bacterium]